MNIIIIIFFSFLFISSFIDNIYINKHAMTLCIFFLIKWTTNYRKCTISYLECKLRGVKKEEGYIYNNIEKILNLNTSNNKYFIYLFTIIVLIINYIKVYT